MDNKETILESLSLNERKILPLLDEKLIEKIAKKAELEEVAVLRALEFLSNKNILKLDINQKKIVDLGLNGVLYKQKGLPERRLASLLAEKKVLTLEEAKKHSELNDNEFQAALGALKKKALVNVVQGKIEFIGTKEEISNKSLEEQFLEILPIELEKLTPEQKYSLEQLKNRKNIIEIVNKNEVKFELTKLGEEIKKDPSLVKENNYLEALTPEMLSNGSWKGKKFRRYDMSSPVPKISGGKRHFVNEAIEKGKKIWLEMGFKEMTGKKTVSSFWNFDALFTAQDHPVREIQDTFYIDKVKAKLPDKKLIEAVKQAHEKGVGGSKGWQYKWDEETAKRVLIRAHTTCLSSQTLTKLKPKDLPAKFFAIGKCFRNETVDWKHGFEFNQTEGIVIDPNANLRHLIGYLKEFAKKMGFEKIKIQPSYFPYTEPSLEGYVWNEQRKQWVEVLAAGIFRPEVTIPLLGTAMPVLAWGPGFDRLMMAAYEIQDMREIYANDLKTLRTKKHWIN
jgi:phenylalanyl-tRNA synthetase alpha chain